jgi:hypothetical protein
MAERKTRELIKSEKAQPDLSSAMLQCVEEFRLCGNFCGIEQLRHCVSRRGRHLLDRHGGVQVHDGFCASVAAP